MNVATALGAALLDVIPRSKGEIVSDSDPKVRHDRIIWEQVELVKTSNLARYKQYKECRSGDCAVKSLYVILFNIHI